MSDSTSAIQIVRIDQGSAGEYHAQIPGTQQVGRLTWVEREGPAGTVRVAEHTIVPRELEGRGIARQLVEALIDDARTQGFKVEPQCSYVEAQFRRNPDWADLRA